MSDWFASAFGDAIADVRQRLIDEAWFGRKLGTPSSSHHHDHDPRDRDPEADFYGRDHGFDRDR